MRPCWEMMKPNVVGNDGCKLRADLKPSVSAKNTAQKLLSLQVLMAVDYMYPVQNNTHIQLFAALEAGVDYVDIRGSNTVLSASRQYEGVSHLQNTKIALRVELWYESWCIQFDYRILQACLIPYCFQAGIWLKKT